MFDEVIESIEKSGDRMSGVATFQKHFSNELKGYVMQSCQVPLTTTKEFIKDRELVIEELFDNRYTDMGSKEGKEFFNEVNVFWKVLDYKGSVIHYVNPPFYNADTFISDDPEAILSLHKELKQSMLRPDPTITVYTEGLFHSSEYYDNQVLTVDWDDIILPDSIKEGIYGIIDNFPSSQEYYTGLGSVWKRGIMMIGPPGTGKTLICKASSKLARDVGLKVLYVKDLINPDCPPDSVIKMVFSRAREMSPCLLIFEDIDGFMDKASRNILLNELDGFNNNEGIVVMASSNYPEKLDPAFLKRPSRFDKVYNISLPDRDMIYDFAYHMSVNYDYRGLIEDNIEDFCRRVSQKGENLTIPYIKEAFISAALKVREGEVESFDEEVFDEIARMKNLSKEMNNPSRTAEFYNHNQAGFIAAMARNRE